MSRDAQKDLELCEKATPGPWSYTRKGCLFEMLDVFSGEDSGYDQWFDSPCDEDAAFIATAREALPYYITETLALRAENERLKADNAALVDTLSRLLGELDEHGEMNDSTIQDACELHDKTHPGDSLRTRNATLEGALDAITRIVSGVDALGQKNTRLVEQTAKQALHGGKGENKSV